jgi:hypothetical protein
VKSKPRDDFSRRVRIPNAHPKATKYGFHMNSANIYSTNGLEINIP